jgi:Ca-activated chloride channel family protein
VTPEQKAAAETFRAFLLDKPQQAQALQLGFRPADANAPLGAPIVAANGVDSTQPQTQLDLPSVAVSEAIQALWGQNKKRVEVMVVLDVSGSMQSGGRLEPAKAALRNFISQLNDNDSFGLTTFGTTATVRSALGPLGPKRQALLDQINGLVPEGNTRLIETMREAYTTLSKEPAGERIRALVVLSDGPDSGRTTGPAQTLLKTLKVDAQGTGIKVFTIAYSAGGDTNGDLLKQIATDTGAKTYLAPVDTIEQVYSDIATFF